MRRTQLLAALIACAAALHATFLWLNWVPIIDPQHSACSNGPSPFGFCSAPGSTLGLGIPFVALLAAILLVFPEALRQARPNGPSAWPRFAAWFIVCFAVPVLGHALLHPQSSGLGALPAIAAGLAGLGALRALRALWLRRAGDAAFALGRVAVAGIAYLVFLDAYLHLD